MPPEPDQSTLSLNDHSIPLSVYRQKLQAWGQKNRRDFPWRHTRDPYQILIAEMMLRRTRATQVEPVYSSFLKRYPHVHSLANASEDELAEALYSLGLAWRVPAFKELARVLVESYGGEVPYLYSRLLELPGVGDYVASAICCFAYEQPQRLIDTNTVRVAGRLFAIPTHAESRRNRSMSDLLEALMDPGSPSDYHYSLLDLAAVICLPREPYCPDCPLLLLCATGQQAFAPRST